MKNASIILPAYNEMKSIRNLIKKIKSVGNFEIIVVDDGSTDRTADIARKYSRVLVLEKNMGKGYACRMGARIARYQNLVFMDADGQLSPKDIPNLLDELKTNDLVIGKRPAKNIPVQRRFSNSFARFMVKRTIKKEIADCLCGLRAIRKGDFGKLALKKNGYEFETEMVIKAVENKFKIKYVPVSVNYNDYNGMPLTQSLKLGLYLIRETLK